ncbi:MAG: hypothetical protein DLM70_01250 [Chloroflexi bacterium]|nr:MAG: hypothetical protein DLM70_01250 [Chloroflexota bacterium]
MKLYIRKYNIFVGLLTLLVVGAGLATSAVLAQSIGGGGKTAHNAEAGLSDSQREAIHAAAHAQNNAYLRTFVAQHQDAHELPVVWVQSWAAPPATLQVAAQAAGTIVLGNVLNVNFAPNPSGGLPIATARVQVARTIKGRAASVITVTQLGGPVAHGQGGALAELDADQLILPGDQVVLLLVPLAADGMLRTVQGGGVYFVRNGVMASENSEFYKVTGHSLDQFISELVAAR